MSTLHDQIRRYITDGKEALFRLIHNSFLFPCLTVLFCLTNAQADYLYNNTLYYRYDTTNPSPQTLVITGYVGNPTSIVIPSSIDGYDVAYIGSDSFANCTSLVSITIPDTVTYIGYSAFASCSNLTSITFGRSVFWIQPWAFDNCPKLAAITVPPQNTTYSSIDGVLFDKLQTELIRYPAGKGTTYTIPYGVTSIGLYAFAGSSNLTAVAIPGSVTTIRGNAFDSCTSLTSIAIPGGVSTIYEYAFINCNHLSSVYFMGNAPTMSEEWTGVTGITLSTAGSPSPTIRERVFRGTASNLTFYYPTNATGFTDAFFGNPKVKLEFTYGYTTATTPPTAVIFGYIGSPTSITIPSSIGGFPVTSIWNYAFHNCTSLTSINIPDSVTTIDFCAFYNCINLSKVSLPSGLTSLSEGVFANCSMLSSITIPKSVTSIGKGAFSACGGLTSITIPENVTSIADYAFECNTNNRAIYFRGNAPTLGSDVFTNSSQNLVLYYQPNSSGFTSSSWNGYATSNALKTFESWRNKRFTAAELNSGTVSGAVAAPDGDGIPNLLKYALDIDDQMPDSAKLPKGTVQNGAMILNFTQLKATPDVTYIPEVSTDLVNWHSDASYISQVSSVDHNSTLSVTVKSLLPPSTNPRQYMRLRVVQTN